MKFDINSIIRNPNFNSAKLIDVNLDGLRTVVSFSLYGNVQKYFEGLLKNCEQINQIYPAFWIYVYLGNDFDKTIMNGKFDSIKNIVFIDTGKSGHEVASWRFFAIDRPEVGIAFSRDADSRVNVRDQYCINEFLKSSRKFQIIRDSPSHGTEILAGMFGIKKGIDIHIQSLFERFKIGHTFKFGSDQIFLSKHIYPKVRQHALVFDQFFDYKNEYKVTIPLPYDEHVGAVVN